MRKEKLMKERMKNTIKKVLGILAAVAMVLGVMGADETLVMAAGTCSIQITNAKPGETYSVYKMFSINSSTGSGNDISYNYIVESSWVNFFKTGGEGANYVTLDNNGQVTNIVFTGNETEHAAKVKEFAQKALKYATENNITATKTGTVANGADTVTIDGLDEGYYLVDTTMGSLCMLNNVAGSSAVEIAEKNEAPSVQKKIVKADNSEVEKNTASIGDSVSFKSTITIPSKGGESTSNLKLHDKLDQGLTLNTASIAVKYNNTNLSNGIQYTLSTSSLEDGCTFEIDFVDSYIQNLPADAKIVVTYTATVNSNANIGGTKDSSGNADSINRNNETGEKESPYKGNRNETWAGYGNSSTTEHSTTETDVWSFDLLKRGASSTDALGGAEFKLYTTGTEGTAIKFIKTEDTTRIESGVNRTFNNYRRSEESGSTDTISATTGFLSISGLSAGTYYLEETKAPEGYNKLTSRVGFTINENGTLNIIEAQSSSSQQSIVAVNGSEISNSIGGVQIINEKGGVLPSTGGIGTTIFYVIGGVIVAGAIVLLIARRKRNA